MDALAPPVSHDHGNDKFSQYKNNISRLKHALIKVGWNKEAEVELELGDN